MAQKNILLIDDDTMLLTRTQNLLEKRDFTVALARNTQEGLIALERSIPDLIILSSLLPDADAYTFLEQVKENPDWRFLPVIVLTGKNEHEDNRLMGLRLGVMDYLSKPFDEDELLKHVENILAFYEVRVQANRETEVPSQERLLNFMNERGIRTLIPGVHRLAKLGYEYPEAAQILRPEELGGEIYILESMAKTGLLERVFHDAIHMCPDCGHHDLNFREVCPQCNGADIDAMKMLTCDRCSHRSLEYKFRTGKGLQCPQCLEILQWKNLDYDESTSAMRVCNQCKGHFTEAIVNCRCMNCNKLFDLATARVRKIYSYKLIQDTFEKNPLPEPKLKMKFAQDDIEALIRSQKLNVADKENFHKETEKHIEDAGYCNGHVTILALHFKKSDNDNDLDYEAYMSLFEKIIVTLREILRQRDLICIAAADELHIVLPDTPYRMARVIANRLLSSLTRVEYDLDIHLNMAGYPDDGVTVVELLEILRLGIVSAHPFSS